MHSIPFDPSRLSLFDVSHALRITSLWWIFHLSLLFGGQSQFKLLWCCFITGTWGGGFFSSFREHLHLFLIGKVTLSVGYVCKSNGSWWLTELFTLIYCTTPATTTIRESKEIVNWWWAMWINEVAVRGGDDRSSLVMQLFVGPLNFVTFRGEQTAETHVAILEMVGICLQLTFLNGCELISRWWWMGRDGDRPA